MPIENKQLADELAAHIQRYNNIVITAHSNPDGDALGSCGVIAHILKVLGKRFIIYNTTPIPSYLEWLPLPCKFVTKLANIPFKPELFIVLDCGDVWRLGKELAPIFSSYTSINIDHHVGNTYFGTLANWVEPSVAATGQLTAEIAKAIDIPLTGELAKCLYLSIVTDTGSFTYGNTSPDVLRLAANLIESGLNAPAIREQIDNQWSIDKFKLWGELMQEVVIVEHGQIAYCTVSNNILMLKNATKEDLEGFTEQMRKIKGVRVALLIREDAESFCKISLRSSGTDNVRAVAVEFDGGGHINAAGATVEQDLQTTLDQSIEYINKIILH